MIPGRSDAWVFLAARVYPSGESNLPRPKISLLPSFSICTRDVGYGDVNQKLTRIYGKTAFWRGYVK